MGSHCRIDSTIAPDAGAEAVALNNWDGAAQQRWKTWRKRVSNYIRVDVNEGVIQPTPGDHGRNLFYYPGTFDLKTMAKDYEVCDFEGDVLISDAEHDIMDEFLSWFQ